MPYAVSSKLMVKQTLSGKMSIQTSIVFFTKTTFNPRLTKLFFVTRITKGEGVVATPSLETEPIIDQ